MIKRISLFIIMGLVLVGLTSCVVTPPTDPTNKETYTVTFVYEIGGREETVEVESGSKVLEPEKPLKDGEDFIGWYLAKTKWDFENDTVSKNITLIAKFEPHTHEYIDGLCSCGKEEGVVKTYTITFDTDGGSAISSIDVLEGTEIILPTDPTKEGYKFLGWDKEVPELMPSHNIELKALWEINTYTIRFSTGAGTKIETMTLEYGAKINVPEDPTRIGYDFDGWDKEFPETMPAKNLTFVAVWKGQTKTITFELNGGLVEGELPQSFVVGTATNLPTPSKDGYVFDGWFTNPEFTGSSINRITASTLTDVAVYAKWSKEPIKVTYILNGGNWQYSTREEMEEDFLTDAMEWAGITAKPDGMVQGAGATQVGFANKFSAIYGFFKDAKYQSKWAWLKEYIINATSNVSSKGYLESGNEAFWRYSLGAFIFQEFRSSYPITEDYTEDNAANGFWELLSEKSESKFDIEADGSLKTPTRIYYVFEGWYANPEFTGDKVTSATDTITLYAKWVEETPVDSISITNKIENIDRFKTHQLTWELNPVNAAIKSVEFSSSNEEVAIVDDKGLITFLNNGVVTIRVKSLSPSGVTDQVTIKVSSPDHFDVSYETTSYAVVGEAIKLNAEYIKRDESRENIVFSSLNLDIAEVDSEGNVKALKEGLATIRASLEADASVYFDFVVTVLPSTLSDAEQFIVDAHESNVFERYDLGIGAGTPVYYADIFGSISKMIFNYDAVWQDDYLEACLKNGQYSTGMNGVEFVVVHYTAGMTKGSNAAATAAYFSRAEGVSAHFCTGNDGIFQTLNLEDRGWHAGDGASATFEWNATGVKWNESDPKWPVWGISSDSMFTINGVKTSIKVPYKDQRGNEGYVTDAKWLNDQGFAFKIVDGEYYMGTTWWCYSNVYEGRICSRGGNKHGIGIESAVDFGSDLWYTWQVTAKLVAQLMIKFNLDITRVVGHHFFAAKDCPQPLLENDLEIWWEFIDLVEAEYDALTKYKDYTFELNIKNGSTTINEFGRVTSQPEFSEIVTYEVIISNGTTTETVTLATMVPGQYTK